MDKLVAVIKREYIERVRNRWFVIATVFGPVFFGAVMILPAALSVRSIKGAKQEQVTIVDATGVGLGARVAARLAPEVRDTTAAAKATADSIAASLRAGVIVVTSEGVVELEERLTQDVIANRKTGFLILDTATITTGDARYAGRNAGSVGENGRMESAVRNAVISHRLMREGIDSGTARAISQIRTDVSTERISDKGRGGSGFAGMIVGFAIAFLLYMAIILYGQAILRGVLEEKTTRVAEVIVASVRPDILLAGKVIGVGAVGLTQMLIWVLSGSLLFGLRMKLLGAMVGPQASAQLPANFSFPTIEPTTILAILLFFVLGYTFYASLFAAVGAMVSTQEEANQAAQPVMMLLVASIIFVQPVTMNPTGTLAEVMSLLPFSAPIIMPLRMATMPVAPMQVALSLLSVTLGCVAAVWLSARIYRVGLLMYGKRPSLRELLRWVRQST